MAKRLHILCPLAFLVTGLGAASPCRAQAPATPAAAPGDTLQAASGSQAAADSLPGALPRPVFRRPRSPFPGGVRIRSFRDNRQRLIRLPLGFVALPMDSLRPVAAARPGPADDLEALESRLLARLEARLQELERAQQESLQALSDQLLAASRDTVYITTEATPVVLPGRVVQLQPRPREAGPASGARTGQASPPEAAAAPEGVQGATGDAVIPVVPVVVPVGGAGPADSLAAATLPDSLAGAATDTLIQVVTVPSLVEVERAVLDVGLLRSVSVMFEIDQSTLLPPSFAVLDAVGQVLERHPEVRLEVGGHTDSVGTEEYNRSLAQRRADAVRSYILARFAIEPDRMTAVGFGETRPIASNSTTTGRALNRRVEFRTTGKAP